MADQNSPLASPTSTPVAAIRQQALEEAARYHDDLAAQHEAFREDDAGTAVEFHGRQARAHIRYAADIRALKSTPVAEEDKTMEEDDDTCTACHGTGWYESMERYCDCADGISSSGRSSRDYGLEEAARYHEEEAEYYEARRGDKDGIPFPIVAGWHRLNAERLRSRKSTPVADIPAPADKGLVTVAWEREDPQYGWGLANPALLGTYRERGTPIRALTPQADAEREIAARDERMAVIRGARNYWRERAETAEGRVKEQDAEIENARNHVAELEMERDQHLARIGELEEQNAAINGRADDVERQINDIKAKFAALREEALRIVNACESRIVGLYRGITPHANYDDELTINGHVSGNRTADQDEVVRAARDFCKKLEGGDNG
ncbi:hypothetical protein [Brucella sp. IR073]|uniref:hypothetical protein n=1 Tax=unclassified Brucella TaxID=2632610 RepID=UPI003B98337B